MKRGANHTPNPGRAFKDAIYGQFARLGKGVSSPKRLELLDLLGQGPRTVEALAREGGATIANASQHLQVLRHAGLVESRRRGLYIVYAIADPSVNEFIRTIRVLAEKRLAEVERTARRFLERRDGLEAVPRAELRQRMRQGRVTVIDVRPREEYLAGHLAGAISVPLPELKTRLATFPRQKQIVAYCRGPYCVLAVEAVQMLRAKGFQAMRLKDSVQDWRAWGHAVRAGTES